MIVDPTINLGHLLTITTVIVGSAIAMARQSYMIGQYSRSFEYFQKDLTEIKQTLKDQDEASKKQARADALADGVLVLVQHRINVLEGEMARCRENIHKIANVAQIKIFSEKEHHD
jgi:hypothetical protein